MNIASWVRRLSASLIVSSFALAASAEQGLVEPELMPGPLKEVKIEQHLGESLPLDARFLDEDGNEVRLGDYFGDKPVVLAFVYYECPMLCSMILNGMASSLQILKFDVGQEFDVVTISVDHEETSAMAAEAKTRSVNRYGRPQTAEGWHFLTGSQEAVEQASAAAGYGFEYIPATDEWAHASAIMVVTPEGLLAQYFYGIEYSPKDLRLALVEASANKLGNVVDQILLYCFRYDPQIGKYTAISMRIVRVAGGAFALGLIIFLFLAWRRERLSNMGQETPTPGAV